ncbi:hypothetical protein SEA_YECEY3_66 [Mycobacterium phage Yecey3]|uniref:Uncharacterized protein n=1 Tax=Mycobacterium phage Yecey3 TaxID=2656617 RepID=A0A649V909_9CAUD|nr:hypothetical protein KIV58_gp043 [Mycobacterium phage Yecey3]QGJ88817.1 hypothetical protein SEA_YECEY3_66 [Mycobacterium phage Yecey3]
MKYGVRYPRSGIHQCPFGFKQAAMIELLAIRNGVSAKLVKLIDGKWQEI